MSHLPANSRSPQIRAEEPRAEVGGARWEPEQPQEERGGRMAAAGEDPMEEAVEDHMLFVAWMPEEVLLEEWPQGRARAGNARVQAAGPHPYHALGPPGYNHYRLHEQAHPHYVEFLLPTLDMINGNRIRDAQHQRVYISRFSFPIDMSASVAIEPLIEELGCDGLLSRE